MAMKRSIFIRLHGITRHSSSFSTSNVVEGQNMKGLKGFKDIPGMSKSQMAIALLGMGNQNFDIKRQLETNQALWDSFGDIVRLEVPGRDPMIMTFDPKLSEIFFRASGAQPNRPFFAPLNFKRDTDIAQNKGVKSKGLLTSQGKEWHNFRSKVQQPMMRPQSAVTYTSEFERITMDFINNCIKEKREGQKEDDFLEALYRWALESATFLALDMRLHCFSYTLGDGSDEMKMINAVADMFKLDAVLEYGIPFWKIWPQFSSTYKKFSQAYDTFVEVTGKYMHASIAHINSNDQTSHKPTILEQLVRSGCDEELAITMATDIMFAGIDTTSHAMVFLLYELANDQNAQDRVYEEVKKHLPTKDSTLEDGTIERMPMVRAAIKEGLRLYPPVTAVPRALDSCHEIGGYYVDRKCFYLSMNCNMCRSPRYFREPTTFLPERWIRGHEIQKREIKQHPFLYLPFGHGPRMCIGKRFAEREAAILLAKLLQNFCIKWKGPKDLGVVVESLMKPDKKVRFEFVER